MTEVPAPEGQVNGGGTVALNPSEPVGSKRQRRPSVRLGDIGDQPVDSHIRRSTTTKPWRLNFTNNASGKPSKTRPLTNLTPSSATEFGETLETDDREAHNDSVVIGSWKVKDSSKKRVPSISSKRPRSNWGSRIDEGEEDVDDDDDDGYVRDFDVENSESPIHSMENNDLGGGDDDGEAQHYHHHNHHGNVRDRNGNSGGVRFGEDGVRIWLNGLGLGRYAPLFQIHEVDDEVLPLLTLEDLKDMGINAVGSRRKMYCAIQKLGKGFS